MTTIRTQSLKFSFIATFLLSLAAGNVGADTWDDLTDATQSYRNRVTYDEVMATLPVFVSPALLASGSENPDSFIIENSGRIEINRQQLLAYDKAGNLRFEFNFVTQSPVSVAAPAPSADASQRFQGLRIFLDSNTENALQDQAFGEMDFSEFAKTVHGKIKKLLTEGGADVTESLRPSDTSPREIVARENAKPNRSHLVLGLWYSADQDDFMMTFAEGFIAGEELESDLSKTAFIHSLISGKFVNSLHLAGAITSRASEAVKASLLNKGPIAVVQNQGDDRFFFEKSSRAVPAGNALVNVSLSLPSTNGRHFDGIGVRNTFINKLFSRATAVAFPNRTVFQKETLSQQMDAYAAAVVDAIAEFLQRNPALISDGQPNSVVIP